MAVSLEKAGSAFDLLCPWLGGSSSRASGKPCAQRPRHREAVCVSVKFYLHQRAFYFFFLLFLPPSLWRSMHICFFLLLGEQDDNIRPADRLGWFSPTLAALDWDGSSFGHTTLWPWPQRGLVSRSPNLAVLSKMSKGITLSWSPWLKSDLQLIQIRELPLGSHYVPGPRV